MQLRDEILSGKELPRHVAIIMDGNGRWARQRGLPRVAGHREGVNSVREIVEVCGELGIDVLTLYTFSKENWSRPKDEVTALMRLLLHTIKGEVNDLAKNNVRLKVVGELDDLPYLTRKSMVESIDRLKSNTGLLLNLALSYSSRREILSAVKSIARDTMNGILEPDEVDEEVFSRYLYTADIPDPDLVIRTSGELRISNFLLWQIAYAEIYVTDVFWPDFRREKFYEAIYAFQQRDRRFGRVKVNDLV